MSLREQKPWVQAAVGLLDVRRRDRILAFEVDVDATRQLATLAGKDGEVLAVVGDPQQAEQLADLGLPQLRVLAHELVGNECFGSFDAMLVLATTGPLLPIGAYPDLARQNLRPGGRLVIDVPGLSSIPDLATAWSQLGWDAERLQPLMGVADDVLADALRHAGLRNVHAVLGAHLLHAITPGELVATFADALQLTGDEPLQLTHALVRQKGGTDPTEALAHRTRVTGLR